MSALKTVLDASAHEKGVDTYKYPQVCLCGDDAPVTMEFELITILVKFVM